jgi:hypothetical protein
MFARWGGRGPWSREREWWGGGLGCGSRAGRAGRRAAWAGPRFPGCGMGFRELLPVASGVAWAARSQGPGVPRHLGSPVAVRVFDKRGRANLLLNLSYLILLFEKISKVAN